MVEGTALIILNVKELQPIEDRNISKTQSECQLCGCPLGSKGASQSQKHVCRFCFNSVCSACSPLTAQHPEKQEALRICLKCYAHYLKIQIEDEDIPRVKLMIEEEIKKIEQETHDYYARELAQLRAQHHQREKDMKDQAKKLDEEIQEKDLRISSVGLNSEKQNNRNKDSLEKFIKEMKEKEQENQNLRMEIESLKESHRKMASVQSKKGCLSSCEVF